MRDPRKYERDCEERPLREVFRAELSEIALTLGVGLALVAILAIGVFVLPAKARAAEWSPPQYNCIPTVSDFDHAYRIRDAIAAAVWWCDMPEGLYTWSVAGTVPGGITPKTQADALLAIAGKDPGELLKRVVVRDHTPSEAELVAQIELSHAPRCYVVGTAATAAVLTANAQGAIGAAKLDAQGVGVRVAVGAPVACYDRLAKETAKRYCSAATLTDTKGRRVEPETWIACKIERAPAAGWDP